jgi:hypothetical protein
MVKPSKKINYYDWDARNACPILPQYHENLEELVPLKPKKKKPVDKLAKLLEGLNV